MSFHIRQTKLLFAHPDSSDQLRRSHITHTAVATASWSSLWGYTESTLQLLVLHCTIASVYVGATAAYHQLNLTATPTCSGYNGSALQETNTVCQKNHDVYSSHHARYINLISGSQIDPNDKQSDSGQIRGLWITKGSKMIMHIWNPGVFIYTS